jgi:hypothetical protein
MYFYVHASNVSYLFNPPSGNYPYPQYLKNPKILIDDENLSDLIRTKLVGLVYLFTFFNFIFDKFLINYLYKSYFLIFLITNFFTIILLKKFFDKMFNTNNNILETFLLIYPFLLYPFSIELFALFFTSIVLNLIIYLKTQQYFKKFIICFLSIFIFLIANSQIFLIFFIIITYLSLNKINLKNFIIFFLLTIVSFFIFYFLTLLLFNLDIIKLTFWRLNKINQTQQLIPFDQIKMSILSSFFNKAVNLGPIFILFILNIKNLIKNNSYLTFFTFFLLILADIFWRTPESTRQMQNLSIIFSFIILYQINKKIDKKFIYFKENFYILSAFTLFYMLAFHSSLPIIEFQFSILNEESLKKLMLIIHPPLPESNYFFSEFFSRKILWKIILIFSFLLLFKNYLIRIKFLYNSKN